MVLGLVVRSQDCSTFRPERSCARQSQICGRIRRQRKRLPGKEPGPFSSRAIFVPVVLPARTDLCSRRSRPPATGAPELVEKNAGSGIVQTGAKDGQDSRKTYSAQQLQPELREVQRLAPSSEQRSARIVRARLHDTGCTAHQESCGPSFRLPRPKCGSPQLGVRKRNTPEAQLSEIGRIPSRIPIIRTLTGP